MTIQDLVYQSLGSLGYAGGLVDRQFKFFKDNGAVSNNVVNAEFEWLTSLGYTQATLLDKRAARLRNLGYTDLSGYTAAFDGLLYYSHRNLFLNNEKGVWYDPSDLDAGKIAWRRNLLTYSEQFDNAAWVKTDATVVQTGDEATITATVAGGRVEQLVNFTQGLTYTWSVEVQLAAGNGAGNIHISGVAQVAFTATSEWQKVTTQWVATSTLGFRPRIIIATAGSSIRVRRAQLEVGSAPTAYQRITDFNSDFIAAFPSHTLFQDAAGTTPVTKAGEPVGLVLDKSKGLVRGPELVTNGDFANGLAGWTATAQNAGSAITVEGGRCRFIHAAGAALSFLRWSGLDSSKAYEVVLDVEVISGALYAEYATGGVATVVSIGANRRVRYVASGRDSIFFRSQAAGVGVEFYIDNVSVRELPGNHASQSTAGARPTLRQTPVLGSELVTNGAFDADANWTKGAGWTISGGVLVATGVTGNTIAQQNIDTVVGRTYSITYSVVSISGGSVSARYQGVSGTIRTTVGTFTETFVATGVSTQVGVIQRDVTALTATIDNISVREVTSYRTDQNYLEFDGVDDFLVTQSIDFGTVSIPDSQKGPELVTNGTFDSNASGWTSISSTLSAVAGKLRVTATGANAAAYQGIPCVVGKTYQVVCTLVADAMTGNTLISVGTSAGGVQQGQINATSTPGTYSLTFVATQATHYVAVGGSSSSVAGETLDFDNISAREIPAERAADKMTVVAGVRKMSDAATAAMIELGVDSGATAGTFGMFAPGQGGANKFDFRTKGSPAGTFFAAATATSFNAPRTAVVTGIGNISGDVARLRIDGAQAAENLGDQGTGNYGNYPLYIGRRGGTSLPFNGRLYGLIVRGAASTLAQIIAAEREMAKRTGVVL